MTEFLTLLRGINVNGSKMIKMHMLKELYASLHFSCVKSYIQSGNIIFSSDETNIQILENLISDAIKTQFGFEVPLQILPIKTLLEIAGNNPFLQNNPETDPAYLHITFLKDTPAPNELAKLQNLDFPNEKFTIIEQTVYLYLPNGYGNARLNNNFIESKLKTSATTRNWKTISALAAMAQ